MSFLLIIQTWCRQFSNLLILRLIALFRLITLNQRSINEKVLFFFHIGIGKYVGYVLLVSYFTVLPKVFEFILPFLLDVLPCKFEFYCVEKLIMGLGIMVLNIVILLCYNAAMYFIYRSKNPFFEKYRVSMVNFVFKLRKRGLGKKIMKNGKFCSKRLSKLSFSTVSLLVDC